MTSRLIQNMRAALASMVYCDAVEVPTWLSGSDAPAADHIACANGLLHVPTRQLLPATPRYFGTGGLEYGFDPGAQCPAWLDFLGQLWPEDPASIALLQEWYGLMLVPVTKHQKILLIVGPRRSGKGTIARVLYGMVGPSNFVAPTLGSLATNFGLAPLIGKQVGVIPDARLSKRSDQSVIVERLLSISGEDLQTVDRKHLPHLTCRLPVRFTILTNELPNLSDSSSALSGRFLLLRLQESWYGREDTSLTERLLAELPGILNWALLGLERLQSRGHFMAPASSAGLAEELAEAAAPIELFLRQCCDEHPQHTVLVPALYQRWCGWCEEMGHQAVGSVQQLGRDLRAARPHISSGQVGTTSRLREYRGLRLRP